MQSSVCPRFATRPRPPSRRLSASTPRLTPWRVACAAPQVYDQYLNFISLEPRLFSLRLPEAFVTLNSASSLENEISHTADAIASGLLSVLVTLGTRQAHSTSPALFPT